MSRIKNLFRVLLILFITFAFVDVKADTANISVESISIKDKSETITVEEPVITTNEITSNVTFNKVNDFVSFSLVLKNNKTEKYKIISIKDNNTNTNLKIDYTFNRDFIKPGETSPVEIKLTYKNKLVNQDKININDLNITIELENDKGESQDIIINNPTTGDNILMYMIFLILALTGMILISKKTKVKEIKIGSLVLLISLLTLPFVVFGIEKYEVKIKFTDIEIKGEFEKYNITINPGNGNTPIVKEVTYGQKIGELPTTPSKEGYDFEKWVDNKGNEVTEDTVITGPISVEAKYKVKEYTISYDLNGGTVTGNPEKYTIESNDITLKNPSKEGYTFTGWTGTGIDTKTTSVTIESGSTGNRNYTANYSSNEDTAYKVKHRYQKLDSGYEEEEVTEYGETGKEVEAPIKSKTGFANPSVQRVTIKADGSSEVIYNYDREIYTFNISDRTYIDSTSTVDGNYPYETEIKVKALERAGYDFVWSDGSSSLERKFKITEPTSLTPVYTAKTNTPYKVVHQKQKIDGTYEVANTQILTGTTDSEITPAVNTYEGFTSPEVQTTTIKGDGTTVVTYNYTRNKYTLTIENPEYVEEDKSGEYYYEEEVTLKAIDREGYTFAGWSNGETTNPLTITLSSDLTIEPVYTSDGYTVTFNSNGGGNVDSITVAAGESIQSFITPTAPSGKIFDGWYTELDEGTKVTAPYTPESNITLYAHWNDDPMPTVFSEPGECTFNGSNGVLTGDNCSYANGTNKYIDTGINLYNNENHDKDYEIGFTIVSYDYSKNVNQATFMNTKLEGNSYPGLVFRKNNDGDKSLLDFSSRKTSSANERETFTYSDEIKVKIYRIYNENLDTQEIFYSINDEDKVMLNDLSQFNPEFNLSVWFGAAPKDASASSVQRYLVGTMKDMYIKLGTYQESSSTDKYKVTYNANGGSVSPTSKTINIGDQIGTLPTPTPPTNKTFDGWYTELTGGIKVTSSYIPNNNITIYARYTNQTYTVTFDTDGGSSVANQTITYGNKATRPTTDPTKTGYTFDNWYTDTNYDTVFDFDNITITSATTIYAHFVDPCRTFSTDSWSTIKDNLESDSSYYAVGCEKEVELDMDDDGTNESYTVRLANTSTPEVCSTEGYSQTACGTVIEFVDIATTHVMNSSNTNAGGWKETEMVTYLNNNFYNKLPSDLQSVIIPTYPIVSGSGPDGLSNDITETDITKNKIYLLSNRELNWNATSDSKGNVTTDTRVLDYYTNINTTDSKRIKKNISGDSQFWWMRSPLKSNATKYTYVTDVGGLYMDVASYSYGVAPAFRIGTMPEFTVFFDTDGGSSVTSQTITYGENATRPSEDPTKDGYTFDNWYTDDTYTTVFDFDTPITSDTTIYAHFEELKVCADNENITRLSENTCSNNENITVGDGIVCKRAIKLHEETCSQTSTSIYCSGAGYTESGGKGTSTITYGNCGTSGTLTSGDAFTCDVNGDEKFDELTERFYYVSDYYDTSAKEFDTSTAVLIYYNNVTSGVSCNKNTYAYSTQADIQTVDPSRTSYDNWHGPLTVMKQLPTTSQWSNVSLKSDTRAILGEYQSTHNSPTTSGGTLPTDFSYEGYAARLLTAKELMAGCNLTEVGRNTIGELDSCNYVMENTKYAKSSIESYGGWLETPRASYSISVWNVYGYSRSVNGYGANNAGNIGARPAIEVLKSKISY